MPTLAELKTVLERVLKDPHLKAETYARPLRKAELITTGGRGSSAPQVTPRDAANLLIAILSPASAIRGPETVEQYRSLPRLHGLSGRISDPDDWPQTSTTLRSYPLAKIKEITQFGKVVELLIWRTANGPIGTRAQKWEGGSVEPGLSLRLVGPDPSAVLDAPMLSDFVQQPVVYARKDDSPSTTPAGIERVSVIHEDVLIAIGRLFQDS